MRIAYVSTYQGPGLLKRRPIVINRSLANTIKLELIAGMLHAGSHEVEVLSQGEVVEHKCTFYPAFQEPQPFNLKIPVFYASALPIRKLKPLWSSLRMLQLFLVRHRVKPFDVAIIWNLQHPQLVCARYAIRHLGIPVVLEYEDDAFVDIWGEPTRNSSHRALAMKILQQVSGCIACSPRLLTQVRPEIPKLLLRGVVGQDLITASRQKSSVRSKRVLFSGTHYKQYGIPLLIAGWKLAGLADWTLHITGEGPQTAEVNALAAGCPSIHCHGMVSREKLVSLMASAKVCVNPHEVSQTPGNVFAFKIIEYLAAGAHVITTPMGPIEPELERGITYIPDNRPETIAQSLRDVIRFQRWESSAAEFVCETYGPAVTGGALESLIRKAIGR